MKYDFSNLMTLIGNATIPAAVAEHVFANKDVMAKSLADTGFYSFKIGDQTIEVRRPTDA